jgi:hypothetical protein
LVAHGSIIPYRRLVSGILSAQQRLSAIGVTPAQTVAISVAHPIDHLVFVCALYRMKVASATITDAVDGYLDRVPFDLVLSDKILPTVSTKQPSAKFNLVDTSWFQDQVTFDLAQRTSSRRDPAPDWVARITCYPDGMPSPKVVKTTSHALEEQLMAYCLSAPPKWERMITVAGLHTNTGLAQALSALWLGRSVCFADVHTARSLAAIYKHDYLVVSSEDVEPLLRLQDTQFAPLHDLQAACFEGRACSASTIARGLATISSNLLIRYVHPEVGIVAYGDASKFRTVDGAAGFVAPWVEAQVMDAKGTPVAPGKEGILRFRRRDQLVPGSIKQTTDERKPASGESWIYPQQRAKLSANDLLVVTGAATAA